jgi:hypothetical protein
MFDSIALDLKESASYLATIATGAVIASTPILSLFLNKLYNVHCTVYSKIKRELSTA